jgi:sugar phosphate permease
MKGKVNSGLMAGILNGCCYVGSMASSYGLGLIAKNFGWTVAFWVLFTVCAIVTAIATVYFVVKKLIEKIKDTKKDKVDYNSVFGTMCEDASDDLLEYMRQNKR